MPRVIEWITDNGIEYAAGPYACARGADALVILTEWDAFRALDLKRLRRLLRQPVVVDLRNIYRPHEMERHGFRYTSIGRGEQPSWAGSGGGGAVIGVEAAAE